jgi:hypothetical protein
MIDQTMNLLYFTYVHWILLLSSEGAERMGCCSHRIPFEKRFKGFQGGLTVGIRDKKTAASLVFTSLIL